MITNKFLSFDEIKKGVVALVMDANNLATNFDNTANYISDHFVFENESDNRKEAQT